jgi:membrane associated rhomboid family serine protease
MFPCNNCIDYRGKDTRIPELLMGEAFIMRWSFIPSEIAAGRNLITILTAMFTHGGVFHIAGNMIYLWALGPEIEDLMGN